MALRQWLNIPKGFYHNMLIKEIKLISEEIDEKCDGALNSHSLK